MSSVSAEDRNRVGCTYVEFLLMSEPIVNLGDSVVSFVGDELVLGVELVQLLSHILFPTLDARPLP